MRRMSSRLPGPMKVWNRHGGSDWRRALVHLWPTGNTLWNNILKELFLIHMQCNIYVWLLTHADRHTPLPPSSPYICRSSWPLQKEGWGEREREETKRGREGERGLVFTRLTHPHLPLYNHVLVLSISFCTNSDELSSFKFTLLHLLLFIDWV